MQTPSEVVDEVLRNFAERGDRHYGEDVTERQHALQCATFAQRNGEAPGLIIATVGLPAAPCDMQPTSSWRKLACSLMSQWRCLRHLSSGHFCASALR